MYNLVLVDSNAKFLHIHAVGIPKLSGKFGGVKIVDIKKVFPHHEVVDEELERDGGDLDLLIGTDLAELHPVPVETEGKLVLLKSRF